MRAEGFLEAILICALLQFMGAIIDGSFSLFFFKNVASRKQKIFCLVMKIATMALMIIPIGVEIGLVFKALKAGFAF